MTAILNGIISRVRRSLADRRFGDDAALLTRVTECRDPEAFEILVGRHAQLVWGVCRRNLANHADREDVFQATFLALVRQIRRLDAARP